MTIVSINFLITAVDTCLSNLFDLEGVGKDSAIATAINLSLKMCKWINHFEKENRVKSKNLYLVAARNFEIN